MSISTLRFGAILHPMTTRGTNNAIQTQEQAAYYTLRCYMDLGVKAIRMVRRSDGDCFIVTEKNARALERELATASAATERQAIIDTFLNTRKRIVEETAAFQTKADAEKVPMSEMLQQLADGLTLLAERSRFAGD